MKNILVTGTSGQLGRCFQKLSEKFADFNFLFCNSSQLDITSKKALSAYFSNHKIDICINCAAYTNVEQAEKEKEKAFLINSTAVRQLAEICKTQNCTLYHISTDYVFDGKAKEPYSETDEVNPINVYGASKLKGEEQIQQILSEYFIFRTSWLYSQYGHNFYNTILKKAQERATLNITTAQTGTPTNANDLAAYILKVIELDSKDYGIYHYSNEGQATWFDFSETILNFSGNRDQVSLNKSGFYQTLAERPSFSVLSKQKLKSTFDIPILDWKTSLKALIDEN